MLGQNFLKVNRTIQMSVTLCFKHSTQISIITERLLSLHLSEFAILGFLRFLETHILLKEINNHEDAFLEIKRSSVIRYVDVHVDQVSFKDSIAG